MVLLFKSEVSWICRSARSEHTKEYFLESRNRGRRDVHGSRRHRPGQGDCRQGAEHAGTPRRGGTFVPRGRGHSARRDRRSGSRLDGRHQRYPRAQGCEGRLLRDRGVPGPAASAAPRPQADLRPVLSKAETGRRGARTRSRLRSASRRMAPWRHRWISRPPGTWWTQHLQASRMARSPSVFSTRTPTRITSNGWPTWCANGIPMFSSRIPPN